MRYSCYNCSQNIQIEVRFAARQDHKNRLNCTAWYAFQGILDSFKMDLSRMALLVVWKYHKQLPWVCRWKIQTLPGPSCRLGAAKSAWREIGIWVHHPHHPHHPLHRTSSSPILFLLSLSALRCFACDFSEEPSHRGWEHPGGIQSLGIHGAFPSASW